MSYCRFSTDDFQCDLYVCESVHDYFVIHVAKFTKSRCPPKVSFDDTAAWLERHQIVMAMLDDADRTDIGLPYDGETFDCADANECADKLQMLAEIGYRFPTEIIQELRDEAMAAAQPAGEN